ncbi:MULTISPECIES: hypothetical protein [Planktothrix]|jgi:hypothetical protein|uniref:Uncharacterized protein n=2 Tax=Planktothrix TaxID=54304 RepID=A0A4V0XUY5_PLAAG|nr:MULTISPECIES: hypothetical protein [Planktothrix]CAC5342955.1 hypothetical protein PLAN_30213 [Planktothrix rubescens NIVA-CYA 18]CAD5969870.1 hypothetical protein NO108_04079 [Planktothrix rubescens]CAD5975095.1 hypothetical protein PCC7821_04065 [Planktothrix rubescens NIVA-CYA 18]CAH2574614.1 hypothetical protein PRNO82_03975 [Planktothrix rubescens]GDZ95459.1 hypothetical protein PA905_37580 [Planktothrix agardhii CCAP 1459/11A]
MNSKKAFESITLPNKPPNNILKHKATSTVGRGKVVKLDASPSFSQWSDEFVTWNYRAVH